VAVREAVFPSLGDATTEHSGFSSETILHAARVRIFPAKP
jgi:hypothetical protein